MGGHARLAVRKSPSYSPEFPIIALRYYDFTGDRDGLVKLIPVATKY